MEPVGAAMITKANTEFMTWWKALNEELGKLWPGQQVGYSDARNYYDMGESPETAATKLMVAWS